jgi:hypothetical protein
MCNIRTSVKSDGNISLLQLSGLTICLVSSQSDPSLFPRMFLLLYDNFLNPLCLSWLSSRVFSFIFIFRILLCLLSLFSLRMRLYHPNLFFLNISLNLTKFFFSYSLLVSCLYFLKISSDCSWSIHIYHCLVRTLILSCSSI